LDLEDPWPPHLVSVDLEAPQRKHKDQLASVELQQPHLDLGGGRLKEALVPQEPFPALPKSQLKQVLAQRRQVEAVLWLELQGLLQSRVKDWILANLRGHRAAVVRLLVTKGSQVLLVLGWDPLKVPAKSKEPRSFSADRPADSLKVRSHRRPPTHRQLPRTFQMRRVSHWLA